MAFSLIFHQRVYTQAELQEITVSRLETATIVGKVLSFVIEWQSGQHTFTMQTSGSTGVPKTITILRSHMQASARLTLNALDIQPGEQALLCMNADFIGGRMMLVRAMEGGLPLVVVAPTNDPFIDLPADAKPVFGALVPMQLQAILNNPTSLAKLNQMKAVIIGGAPISPALEQEVQQLQVPLYSTYGMTETVSHIALRRINGSERQDCFQVLPGVAITVDSRGCLVIEGPMAAGPVVTNDLVELIGTDRFKWLGRADNTINSGGIKIQAEKIEAAAENYLLSKGISRRLLAGGLPDEKLGQKVVLLLEGEALSKEQELQLIAVIQNNLPQYWAPKDILYLPGFVESNNGKIKRTETWSQLQRLH